MKSTKIRSAFTGSEASTKKQINTRERANTNKNKGRTITNPTEFSTNRATMEPLVDNAILVTLNNPSSVILDSHDGSSFFQDEELSSAADVIKLT